MRRLRKTKVKLLVTLLSFVLLFCGTMGNSLAWLLDSAGPVKNTFTDSDVNITLEETTGDEYKMIPGWTNPKDPFVTVKEGSESCYIFVKIVEDLGSWADNKVEKNDEETSPVFTDYLEYSVLTGDNGWTAGNCDCIQDPHGSDCNGVDVGVYYRSLVVNTTTQSDETFYILQGKSCEKQHSNDDKGTCIDCKSKNGFVTVKDIVTKEMMDEIDGFDDNGQVVTNEIKPTLTFTAAAVQYYKSNNELFPVAEAYLLVESALNPTTTP